MILEIQSTQLPTAEQIAKTKNLLKARLYDFGFSEINITSENANPRKLFVETKKDTTYEVMKERLRSAIKITGLNIWNTHRITDFDMSKLKSDLQGIEDFQLNYRFDNEYSNTHQEEILGRCEKIEQLEQVKKEVEQRLANYENIKLLWSYLYEEVFEENGTPIHIYSLYLIDTKGEDQAPIAHHHLEKVQAVPSGYSWEWLINAYFDKEGADILQQLSKKAMDNNFRSLAFVVDDKVYSAPSIRYELDGGAISISGLFDTASAKELAKGLRQSIEFPFPLKLVEE